jgi:phthiocerol/phenolphthiocerol synthesis type-I polyketide synthase C
VDVEQPLLNLGLDSLMAVELAIRIHAMVEVDVPVMKLMEGPSVAGLAAFVLERLSQTRASAAHPASQETAEQVPNA